MLRFYLDEDSMSDALILGLRARGVEVTSAAEQGMRSKSDPEQLAFAAANGLVLYSFNVRDFSAIHWEWVASGRSHSGIALEPNQLLPVGDQLRRLSRLIAARSEGEMRDQIEYLRAWDS